MHRLGDVRSVPSVVIDVDRPGTFPRPIPLLHPNHEIGEVRLLLRYAQFGRPGENGGKGYTGGDERGGVRRTGHARRIMASWPWLWGEQARTKQTRDAPGMIGVTGGIRKPHTLVAQTPSSTARGTERGGPQGSTTKQEPPVIVFVSRVSHAKAARRVTSGTRGNDTRTKRLGMIRRNQGFTVPAMASRKPHV